MSDRPPCLVGVPDFQPRGAFRASQACFGAMDARARPVSGTGIVADNDTLMLSQRDFEAFVAGCESPPAPNEALRELMARR
jgi:hypothetical protein